MSLRVVGAEKVKKNLGLLVREIDPVVVDALKKVAEKVKEEAKSNCPVDTGALRKSIRRITTAERKGHVTRVGVRAGGYEMNPKTGRLVDYAVYVEMGTSRQRPQPFLVPAAQGKAWPILREILVGIKKTVSRFAR